MLSAIGCPSLSGQTICCCLRGSTGGVMMAIAKPTTIENNKATHLCPFAARPISPKTAKQQNLTRIQPIHFFIAIPTLIDLKTVTAR